MLRKELEIAQGMDLTEPDSQEIEKFDLLFHRILLQRMDVGETMGAEGLIAIPEAAKGVSILCKVVVCGPGWPHDTCPTCEGRQYEPLCVQPGDIVIIAQNSGYDIRYKNTDCTIITEEELLAVVERAQTQKIH